MKAGALLQFVWEPFVHFLESPAGIVSVQSLTGNPMVNNLFKHIEPAAFRITLGMQVLSNLHLHCTFCEINRGTQGNTLWCRKLGSGAVI